ncbi:MAG: AAA family ATPase [Erysipelotrichaceae bacterium]|nr:AAA family ATPase [Erysipelotrichaceae bacterium]MDD3923931.1 AAA family ATPase [Erysipelotrichaceae bacterium]
MFKTRLISEQPIAFHTLSNSLKEHKVAHAYLFVGPNGTPKLETAYLLAQSLICRHKQVFACEVCDDCKRILSGNYADLIYLSGRDNKIKKEEIINLQEEFSKTGLEEFNQKIYIIDHAENATPEALNSLLKFLEEPSGSSTTAILLTQQSDRILPTIRSRCQIIQFKALSRDFCYNICISSNYDQLDSYLLANLVRNMSLIDKIIEEEEYQNAKFMFKMFIDDLINDSDKAIINIHNEGLVAKDKNRKVVSYFLDMIIMFYADLFRAMSIDVAWYSERLALIKDSPYMDRQILNVLLKARDTLVTNANINLLMDQMFYQIQEVVNGK